jgi:phosphopantothenoylcysteine synthetase/decarboxylase
MTGTHQVEFSAWASLVVFSPKKPEIISKTACFTDISLATACMEDYTSMVNLIASGLSFYHWTNNVRSCPRSHPLSTLTMAI